MAVAASPEGMPLARLPQTRTLSAVRTWLYVLAALVVLMVAVGGATRLTGSGLSITEWKPVTGAIPPLTEQAWMAEFEKYRQISQYELVNKGMTLSEFKVIYGWEWGHRQLGRLLGLVFFLPLAWFWARGIIRGRLALTLLAIGALGGLQATVGWIMVASGLEPGMTAVAPIKLTLHLTIASIILACLVWVAAGLKERSDAWREKSIGSHAPRVLAALILLQIALGGLVAGSKAGLTYNTWPLMDGAFVPPASALFVVRPWIENFVDNVVLVQFNHRMAAYAVVAFALWHAWSLSRTGAALQAAGRAIEKGFGKAPVFNREGGSIPVVATFQEMLGIPSVLFGIGLPDENAHAPNEKLDLGNFHGGVIASAYLYDEIGRSRAES